MVNCSNERIGTVYGRAFDRKVSGKTHYLSPPLERKCFGDTGRGSTESSGYSLQNGSRKYEFGWISESTLKMNPYHDELAFLIAINITTESAIHINGKYTIKTVLEMAMPKNEIELARKDHRYAGKLKQRWDKALMQLAELDWQIMYDSETYPEWLRPGSTTGKPKDCKKRIIDLLLEAGVTIKPPGKIPALIAAKKSASLPQKRESASLPRKRKSASATPLEWEPIQKACEAKGWTKQSVIAEKLGISQPLVCQLQKGKPISPQTAAKLWKILPNVLPELSI